MCELVDEHDLRTKREQRVEIHLLEHAPPWARADGHHLQAIGHGLGQSLFVLFDDADHHVGASGQALVPQVDPQLSA
nr:hypothetical protein [Solihabitans fulvus]